MMRRCEVITTDGRCPDRHKSRGLCRRHYAQSNRARKTAAVEADDWDWTAGTRDHDPTAAADFTDEPASTRETLHAPSPPADRGEVTGGDGRRLPVGVAGCNVAAVLALVDRIPEDRRGDYRVILAITMASLIDVGEKGAAANATQLRSLMSEVSAMAEAQEVNPLASIVADLREARTARASAAPA